MLLKIHPDNPSSRRIAKIAEILQGGGLIIFPTDTVYAFACAINQKGAFEKICHIKGVQPRKSVFSMSVANLRMAADYLAQIDTPQYRILNKNLPGPFTFVLNAGPGLPSHMRTGRTTIGVRMPDHNISTAIVGALGEPLITTSVRSDDEILEYFNDPSEIFEEYKHQVDCVIDAGPGTFEPSTVVDLTVDPPEILREGQGVMR